MRTLSRRLASDAPPPLRGRVSFALVCAMVIASTMAALLALNIAATRASYAQEDLSARLVRLTEEQQALAEDLEARQAPAALEREAADLGMVPANRAFVSMRDGTLLGDASPAQPPEPDEDEVGPAAGAGTADDTTPAPPTTTGDAP